MENPIPVQCMGLTLVLLYEMIYLALSLTEPSPESNLWFDHIFHRFGNGHIYLNHTHFLKHNSSIKNPFRFE